MTVNVLGTDYTVTVKKYDEDEYFRKINCGGYCNGSTKKIVLCDLQTYPDWEDEDAETLEESRKRILRHEIVHAFFEESGLSDNGNQVEGSWARNEEMVDWIALQGPKIHKAWQEAGAI